MDSQASFIGEIDEKIVSGQRSRVLVLTKRVATSEDENALSENKWRPTDLAVPYFLLQGEKASNSEKTDGEPKAPFNGNATSGQPATILGRQLKPGLLPMVPELAKQTRSDMMNSVVAPIAQVKQEPQVESSTFIF